MDSGGGCSLAGIAAKWKECEHMRVPNIRVFQDN